jgi:hypothetical protein
MICPRKLFSLGPAPFPAALARTYRAGDQDAKTTACTLLCIRGGALSHEAMYPLTT